MQQRNENSKPAKRPRPNRYPPWAPRFWNGMRIRSYFQLLRENRFQIHPLKYGMTFMVSLCAILNSFLSRVQNWRYNKQITATKPKHPPIFVIGHWRSGTTLLHELMSLDPRFAYPNNFDAFVPGHFLISRYFLYPLVKLLVPKRRPMDNMLLDVSYPQEDDFALCGLGAPTAYRRVAFPNRTSNRDHLSLNLNNTEPTLRQKVRDAMTYFINALTIRYDMQLVLKSPPHTGRVKQLAQWFPGAKFIHISRHPYKLVPSTMRMWQVMDSLQGFQVPKYDQTYMKNYVFECKDLIYEAYFQQRNEMPANQLVELKFEDLVSDPIAEIRRIYQQLELGGFEDAQPGIENYFQSRKDHKKNPFEIDSTLQSDIDSNWRQYMDAFGYQPSPKTDPANLA